MDRTRRPGRHLSPPKVRRGLPATPIGDNVDPDDAEQTRNKRTVAKLKRVNKTWMVPSEDV